MLNVPSERLFSSYVKFIFKLVCFSLAIYMVVIQVLRYLENNDSSSIGFKKFNASPKDVYPTFTFCLKPGVPSRHGQFHKDYLLSKFHITGDDYIDLLKGGEGPTVLLDSNSSTHGNVFDIDYQNVSIKLQEILAGFETYHSNNSVYYQWQRYQDGINNNSNIPFYISFQGPTSICFTRKTEFDAELVREFDRLTLDLNAMKKFGLHEKGHGFFGIAASSVSGMLQVSGSNLDFTVHLHHPGHFTRHLHKPIFVSALGQISINHTNNHLTVNVPQVTMLRRRPTGKIPCNPALDDDETQLITEIMKKVNCIPPYWKDLVPKNFGLSDCNASAQLVDMHDWIIDYKRVMESYDPPCNDMKIINSILLNTYSRGELLDNIQPYFVIQLTYLDESYQEIINDKDFGLGSFWANIGGFIGIFLGYSLLQIPEMIIGVWNRLKSNHNTGKSCIKQTPKKKPKSGRLIKVGSRLIKVKHLLETVRRH